MVTFDGVVRNQTKARQVIRLEYDAYVPMALKEMKRIGSEMRERWHDVECIGIIHRFGPMESLKIECRYRGHVSSPASRIRGVQVCNRPIEADRADMEEGSICRWRGMGRRRSVCAKPRAPARVD